MQRVLVRKTAHPSIDSKGDNESITCQYINTEVGIQVLSINNISGFYLERLLFPGQELVFEARRGGILEIYMSTPISSMLSERIPCEDLQVRR